MRFSEPGHRTPVAGVAFVGRVTELGVLRGTSMISLRFKRPFLAAGALCAAGFIIWPGCASPPLPATRTPVSSLKPADFSFGKGAHPSQDDIVTKVGKPDEYFADLRVACYKLNQVKRRRLVLLFGVLPIAAPKDHDNLEVAMIQFDEQDRAQRIEVRIIYTFPGDPGGLRNAARQWMTKPVAP
jgi:hypothetical protein